MSFRRAETRKVAEDRCCQRLLRKVTVRKSRDALVKWLRVRVLPFGNIDGSQVSQRRGNLRFLGTKSLLVDCQRAPIKRFSFRVALFLAVHPCKIHEAFGDFGVIRSKRPFADGQSPLVERQRVSLPSL